MIRDDPLQNVLSRLAGVRKCGDGHEARCPAHDDQHASLSVALGDDGRVLLHCHAGCAPVAVCKAMGLRLGDLFPPGNNGDGHARIDATYDYRDAAGETVFQVVRYEGKTFKQRRPDGNGGWSWKLGRTPRVLYRLPELRAANPQLPVFVCYSPDTEVLTTQGWTPFPQLHANHLVAQYDAEHGEITFAKPTALQSLDYSGPMVSLRARWLDLLVTPDHRMLVRHGGCRPQVIAAARVSSNWGLPVSGSCWTTRRSEGPSPAQARLLCAFAADGHVCRGNLISWNVKKARKKERLRALFRSNSLTWREREYPSTPGWRSFYVQKRDAAFLLRFMPAKTIPIDAIHWSYAARAALLDEIRHWDGDSQGNSVRLFTSKKSEADAIAAVAVITGHGGIVREDRRSNRTTTTWVVNLHPSSWRVAVRGAQITDDVTTKVYCCTVPTGFIVVRRNGKTVIAGNCEGEKDADRLASAGLIATCNPGGAGKWKRLSDDSALHGRRVVIIADKDAAGRKHADDVAMRLQNRAAEIRVFELPGPGKDASDWLDAGGTVDELLRLVEAARDAPPPAAPGRPMADGSARPNIFIDTEEHRVVRETIAALKADQDLYQRGGILVRVIRDRQPSDGILRCDGSATIQAMPAANLRERMTRVATFTKLNRKGEEVAAHPAPWLVSAVEARAEWDGIRHLMGVSDTPILRPDGSIWQSAGYDERTGVLFEPAPGAAFPPIHPEVNIDDADAALTSLLEVVCDFPFESEDHKAAWLAALLTPLARFAFAGPSPLFLIDANVRGAGKGLLAQTIGRIVLGREMPVSSYAHDSEEMRKKITAIAIAGDRMILFDNLEGSFGNDALDRALTSTRWKDRILGKSEEVELPLIPAWYATGNNVQVAADTLRRIIHVRLDVLDEHPEDRSGFKHDNLLAWIERSRGRLLSAALTILSAYLRSGRPAQNLRPFGSFEGWSNVVREAVVWVGLPDPCLTRTRLAESADTTGDALGQLIVAWRQYDWSGQGVVVSDLLRQLYPSGGPPPNDDASIAMRAALENVVGCPAGKAPATRQVSNRLRHFRRRVVGGVYLDFHPNEYHRGGMVWRLRNVEPGV